MFVAKLLVDIIFEKKNYTQTAAGLRRCTSTDGHDVEFDQIQHQRFSHRISRMFYTVSTRLTSADAAGRRITKCCYAMQYQLYHCQLTYCACLFGRTKMLAYLLTLTSFYTCDPASPMHMRNLASVRPSVCHTLVFTQK